MVTDKPSVLRVGINIDDLSVSLVCRILCYFSFVFLVGGNREQEIKNNTTTTTTEESIQ